MSLINKLQLESRGRLYKSRDMKWILKVREADLRRPAGVSSHVQSLRKSKPHGVIAEIGIINELNMVLTLDRSG